VPESTDIIVIGGGPVGLYALYYAGQRSMTAKVIDALPELGGQLWALYPDNDLYDVAGVPKLKARDLVENLKKQALQFKPEVIPGRRVTGVHRRRGGFEIVTDKGEKHSARAVLLAPGPGAFIPGAIFDKPAKEQKKRGLFIEPKHATELADRRVLICGGKREAIGWAIDAATVADSVTVIDWSDLYSADEARVDSMFTRHVDVMTPYELLEVHGKEKVEAATIIHSESREKVRLKVDAVLMARGQLTNLEPVRNWGLELKDNGIVVERTMQTSVQGIFAAGDIVYYPGKRKTIVSGAGEAAIAINNAKTFVDPTSSLQPPYTAES
jgi:thioredoxin reductase